MEKKKGVNTYIEEVTSSSTPEEIQEIISNAYNANSNLLFVLLVGSESELKSNITSIENSAVSDQKYAYLSGFDEEGNSDFYPEVYIGRFSSRGESSSKYENIKTQISRVISYEKFHCN